MFLSGVEKNYNIDQYIGDISLHNGVPRQFDHLKNKTFSDWEIPPWELFIFKDRVLGKGSFSKVYLAKWRETFVVAKVIDENVFQHKKFLVDRELDIMTKLHHPNIVQFLGFVDDPFVIVLEYIPNGDLLYNFSSLKKREKISIMKDILRGIAYIHERKPYSLIHRDIKPTNILLTKSKVAKVADFGLSKFYNLYKINSSQNLERLELDADLTGEVGTERYMAPEMSKDNSNYTNKIDIYACGILLYEMFENKKYNPQQKFSWYWCPKKIKDIIVTNMLNYNPESRLNALDILKILDNNKI